MSCQNKYLAFKDYRAVAHRPPAWLTHTMVCLFPAKFLNLPLHITVANVDLYHNFQLQIKFMKALQKLFTIATFLNKTKCLHVYNIKATYKI